MVILKTETWCQLGMNYTSNDPTESTAVVKLGHIIKYFITCIIKCNVFMQIHETG